MIYILLLRAVVQHTGIWSVPLTIITLLGTLSVLSRQGAGFDREDRERCSLLQVSLPPPPSLPFTTENTERTENTIWYVVIRYIGRQDDHR